MSSPVTISVIAPIYGVELYIEEFLHSLLGQSYPHLQFIFVNDGTKDSSIDILKNLIACRYAHLNDRIIIIDKENGGLPAARATGMEYVTGDYVWHVDPDDWIERDALMKIAAFITETGFPDFIYFDFYKEYPDRAKHKMDRDYSALQKNEYIIAMYNHRAYGSVWNKCVKRNLYTDNQVFFSRYSYAEDTYLMSQLAGYASTIRHLNAPLYHYRKGNPNALTRQNIKKRKNEYAMNFLDLYEKYRDVPSAENPVAVLFDDILIQAGWYSIAYRLDLFRRYPYLASAIRKARIRTGSDVWLPAQLLTKLVAFFRS